VINLRIGIFGIGAIGGLFAARLVGHMPTLFASESTSKALHDGLILHETDGAISYLDPDSFLIGDENCQVDIAIICGKSADTNSLANLCNKVLALDGIAFSIQNGLGHAETLAQILGWDRVLAGSTIHAAIRKDINEVQWTGVGEISIGSLESSSPTVDNLKVTELMNILDGAGLNLRWENEMKTKLWKKLLLNVAINPIAAIAGIENGEILLKEELWDQSIAVIDEALMVARIEGIEISNLEMHTLLAEVLQQTASNRCSMLQDIMAGKTTEMPSLCGEVVRIAEKHGIPTPLNNQLLTLVGALESSARVK
jgi:2-dehydropantoate 2-reductase